MSYFFDVGVERGSQKVYLGLVVFFSSLSVFILVSVQINYSVQMW